MKWITFLPQKVKAVFRDLSPILVLWQNRGMWIFRKIEFQQNKVLPDLVLKLYKATLFLLFFFDYIEVEYKINKLKDIRKDN